MGGPQRLAERAGPNRAKELIFTGELFDAATLERWSVVNRVYAPDEFEAASRAFAEKVANGPTKAHAATKRLVAGPEGGRRARRRRDRRRGLRPAVRHRGPAERRASRS